METANQRSNRRRIRAASLALCAMVTAGSSVIEAGVPGQRFQIAARAVPRTTYQTGSGLDLQMVVSAPRSSLVGGGYSLSAHAIASPYACASDTIFTSGFDL